jgi:hypothetical protein
MASGGKENKMVFDIRGRRRYAVKIVYAVLAVLMGISLFLVVGPVNIGQLIGNSNSASSAASAFEEEAERIEVRIKKEPEDANLLANLMRSRVNAANSLYELGPEEEQAITPEALQQLQLASEAWSKYLKATKEPAVGAAQFIAPQLMTLATYTSSIPESLANVEAAVEAQEMVADARPTLNSLTTLAFFQALNAEYPQGKKSAAAAEKLANTKFERENIGNELERYEKLGQQYHKYVKEVEAQEAAGGSSGKETLESPLGGGGALGTPGLGE